MRIAFVMPLLALTATPALAQDLTAPPPPVSVSAGATVVSDYRFRGISRSDRRPAVQGSVTVRHDSGFYASVWASSVSGYVANGADAEIDLVAGYRRTFGGTTFDGGATYYVFPGSNGANTDYVEPFVSIAHTLGPVTAKLGAAYAPHQHALAIGRIGHAREDSLYLSGDLDAGIPTTPVSVTAHIGHDIGPSRFTIGNTTTDWSLGASYSWRALTFGASYVDTNRTLDLVRASGRARNIAGAGLVLSVGAGF